MWQKNGGFADTSHIVAESRKMMDRKLTSTFRIRNIIIFFKHSLLYIRATLKKTS